MYLVNGMTASTLLGTTTTLVFQIFTQYMTLVNNVRKDIELGGGFFFLFNVFKTESCVLSQLDVSV